MRTDEPLRIHDLPVEAQRLRQETRELLREIEDRGFTASLQLRAKNLRKRTRRVEGVIHYAESCMNAVRTAFQERTGRELGPDELFTAADLERGKAIVQAGESKAGTC